MMDKVQKHNSFNTNTPSSESYRNYLTIDKCMKHTNHPNEKICNMYKIYVTILGLVD
jgi:hypothetical protein